MTSHTAAAPAADSTPPVFSFAFLFSIYAGILAAVTSVVLAATVPAGYTPEEAFSLVGEALATTAPLVLVFLVIAYCIVKATE